VSWTLSDAPRVLRSTWLVGASFFVYLGLVLAFLYGMISVGGPVSGAGDRHR